LVEINPMTSETAHSGESYNRIVVAMGGNAVLREENPTAEGQLSVVERTVRTISDATRGKDDIIVTHGNGPQVGNRLLQQETVSGTPSMPLDVLVAETQAQIGYMLQQALEQHLPGAAATVVTQSLVDPGDPSFDEPTKPVGPFYDEDEVDDVSFEVREFKEGYRRVVPSPEPHGLVESDTLRKLVEDGVTVVCGGGGGVPVVREDGGLAGVEAVVDKDRTSCMIARETDSDTLVFLTDVDHAYVGYGTPQQRPLGRVNADELRHHLKQGEFGEGTMLPKIEAVLRFVESGGEAVVTTPEKFGGALSDDTGTRVTQ